MGINDKIKSLGEGLKKRLDSSLIDFALEYIGFSESILAFETICDLIADHDVVITKDEYSQIVKIANDFGLEVDNRYTYINPEN